MSTGNALITLSIVGVFVVLFVLVVGIPGARNEMRIEEMQYAQQARIDRRKARAELHHNWDAQFWALVNATLPIPDAVVPANYVNHRRFLYGDNDAALTLTAAPAAPANYVLDQWGNKHVVHDEKQKCPFCETWGYYTVSPPKRASRSVET